MTKKNSAWDGARPYITVITSVFNRRETISKTLNSVSNQTFRNIEYIIN
ncbi:hypothetical protein [Butyrivibrio sp. VCB2006]|nr:hypothetical protein [Butyrivibrio sp. VCB2006]